MSLIFFIGVISIAGVMLGMHFLENQPRATIKLTEPDILFRLARITETSEYDHFKGAARSWNLTDQRAEADFNRYLLQGELPHYVRDYLRKAKQSTPGLQDRRTDFFTGIMPEKKSG